MSPEGARVIPEPPPALRPRVRSSGGFALIIVLIVITVLALLAGSFAFSMKVEMRLAHNAAAESELEWLGRSGVELARYVLANSMGQPYTSLNQLWAGGPGGLNETNSVLAGITLLNNPLGAGTVSIKIVDLERKMNINLLGSDRSPLPEPLRRTFLQRSLTTVMGMDAADADVIIDSLFDWCDPGGARAPTHANGAESDFYLTLTPPYFAKDGLIDDLSELLLVRGVTPEAYWGPNASAHRSQLLPSTSRRAPRESDVPAFPVGLADLFTPLSGGSVNVNTAPLPVLQMLCDGDDNMASQIIHWRAGEDGADGTEDDRPFQSIGMLNPSTVAGYDPQRLSGLTRYINVVSATFEVTVDARIGQSQKRFVAILRRLSPRDVQILQFSWK